MTAEALERFHAKTVADDTGECIVWIAYRDRKGYGGLFQRGRSLKAHRVAYEHWIGPIPDGLQIDHLCRVRSCVNPFHLRAVTPRENTFAPGSRALAALHLARTHCPRGHPYDERNTKSNRRGWRWCRTCHRIYEEQRRRNKKGEQ